MKFAVYFEDNDEYAHMRPKLMPEHLRFLQGNADNIEAAGPMKKAESGDPAGGLWIVEAEDHELVRSLVETDPFWPSGLRKAVHILEWTQVFADGKKQI